MANESTVTVSNDARSMAHPAETEVNAKSGLCANCANRDDCGIVATAKKPIHHCELYVCCSLPRPELVGANVREPMAEQEEEALHLLGLCANCDNRKDCKLPKPASGVWHCEEYR